MSVEQVGRILAANILTASELAITEWRHVCGYRYSIQIFDTDICNRYSVQLFSTEQYGKNVSG